MGILNKLFGREITRQGFTCKVTEDSRTLREFRVHKGDAHATLYHVEECGYVWAGDAHEFHEEIVVPREVVQTFVAWAGKRGF